MNYGCCEVSLNTRSVWSGKRSEVARLVLLAMMLLGSTFLYQRVEAQAITAPPIPSPPAGFKSAMILLPSAVSESDLMIEVIVGEFIETDCNRRTLSGTLVQRTASTGARVHVLEQVLVSSTLMGCARRNASPSPDGVSSSAPARTAKQFHKVIGDGFFLNYSSSAPTFIQVPTDYSVQYRIFTAGKIKDAQEVP
jgi:serine protease inhibitor ecotin